MYTVKNDRRCVNRYTVLMFENLSNRMNKVFRDLSGFGKLAPENIEPALREIRVALLEADVHFKVVKDFLAAVKERALGQEVLESITPADQFVKIVHDELANALGAKEATPELNKSPNPPTKVLLCGLQGAGKTSSAAKLATEWGDTALVALDLKRPAAIEQLRVLAEQVDAPFIAPADPADSVKSARAALTAASDSKYIIFDTAGRLQIDGDLMKELRAVHEVVQPHETILVLDAMTGQEAVNVAKAFNESLPLDSIFLSKTDGDARGGAALSVRYVTGVPIKWIGTGEKPDAIERFHPDRFADRILGMGDVVSLVERAAAKTDTEKMEKMAKRMMAGELNLEMFLDQMREVRKMGPLSDLIGMLPGGNQLAGMGAPSEKELGKFEAVILSMTPKERQEPNMIDHARRRRIAVGSGTHIEDVNRMLKQFRMARKAFSALTGGKGQAKMLRRFLGF